MADITLFDNQQFTGPFTAGLIASATIGNNNEHKACRVFLTYFGLDPSPCSCQLRAVLEKEVESGVWELMAQQHEVINSNDNAPKRQIVLSPLFNANPGVDEFIPDVNGGTRISRTEGVTGKDMRVSIYKTDGAGAPLTQFSLNGYASLYDV